MKLNMKIVGGLFILLNAIVISAIAIYVSVYGMIALFSAHALVVGLMIGSIEVGKLSAATWLKFNWGNRLVSFSHKAYLLSAIIIVSLLTAIGVFGFLSAGHLEQNAPLAGLTIQQQQFQVQLDQAEKSNKRIEGRLAQIDNNINAFLTNGAASKGLRASNSLKTERDKLQTEMEANNKIINDLNTKLAPLKLKSTEVEAKLGPVKYLASAVGYDDPEIAVRIVILLIMIAFDPLAVVLILSAMATFKEVANERNAMATVAEAPSPIIAHVRAEPEIITEANAVHDEPAPEITETEPDPEEAVGDTVPLTPRQIADRMAAPKPAYFAVGDAIPITFGSSGVVEPVPARDIRTQLIDMMEQYPEIVNDLLAAAKDMENAKVAETEAEIPHNPTISNVTGATVDKLS